MFFDLKYFNLGFQFYRVLYEKNFFKMVEVLVYGVDVNWVNLEENKVILFIQVVLGGFLVMCEFFLQNGVNVN